jgi:hypothetical protein
METTGIRLASRRFYWLRRWAVMARQRDLLVGIVGARHWPHGTIAGRQRLGLRHGIQKRFGRREFASPFFVVAFPIHGEGRLGGGKQCDDREHPHGPSMNL